MAHRSTPTNIQLGENEQLVIKYERFTKPNGETVIRRYIQSRLLGSGGFAKVYQFTCMDTQEIYAAKVMTKSSLTDEMHRQKFRAEIKLHKSLEHPNVVKFHRYFEDDDNVYILLEMCDNQSLGQLLTRRKKLTEIEVQCYVTQTAQALKYIHSKKILHRDLKLANLLLNENMELKIADFGLAAKLSSDLEKRTTVCGTPNFMAPEVMDNRKGYSYPADIWSLGVICFNLLTGRLPFEATSSKEIYNKVMDGKYEFPANTPISPTAKDIITKMLVLEPDQRITLSQIQRHPFLNPKEGVPQTMPLSTLVNPPPATASKFQFYNGETPKMSDLYKKMENKQQQVQTKLRSGSVEPSRSPAKTPMKPRVDDKSKDRRGSTLAVMQQKKLLNKSGSSIGNATAETKNSTNRDHAQKPPTNLNKTEQRRGTVLSDIKALEAEYQTTPNPNISSSKVEKVEPVKVIDLLVKKRPVMHARTSSAEFIAPNDEYAKFVITDVSPSKRKELMTDSSPTTKRKDLMTDSSPTTKRRDVMTDSSPTTKRKDLNGDEKVEKNEDKQGDRLLKRYSTMKEEERKDSLSKRPSSTDQKEREKERARLKEIEKANIVKAWPIVRVLYWLDYMTSYGLGYSLSDGRIGVLFNDETKMLLSAEGDYFYYIVIGVGKKEIQSKYTLKQYPQELKEKVMDLLHFNSHFERHKQKTTKETGLSKSNGLMYVKKWLKTKHAALFRFNTEELQVIFIDDSIMTMNADGKKIKFIEKGGELKSYTIDSKALSDDKAAKKRLVYTLEVLEKIWNKKNEDAAKKKGEKAEISLKVNMKVRE